MFRPPKYLAVLSALLGTGLQLCLLTFFVILITIAGVLYEGRGTIMTVFIVCYALTSFVSGYISGGFNSRHSGKSWIRAMVLTASLFPGVTFGIAFVLNTIAIAYHSLAAVPFGAASSSPESSLSSLPCSAGWAAHAWLAPRARTPMLSRRSWLRRVQRRQRESGPRKR